MQVRNMGLLFSRVVTLVVITVAAGLLALMVVPRLLGWQGVVVLSGSMEPALQTGGLAFVRPVSDTASLSVGEVLTFRAPGREDVLITHRIVAVQEGAGGRFFQTRGDANTIDDQYQVPATAVVGVVKLHLPYLGYLVDLLRRREGYYLLVGVPAVLLIATEARTIVREVLRLRQARSDGRREGSLS